MEFTSAGRICGFCGSVGTARSNYAGGLGALMCTRCLDRYHELYATPGWKEGPHKPWWETMSDEEVLAALPKIVAIRDQTEEFLEQFVKVARARSHTWADIGAVLGVSRQAAWQRFHEAVEE